MSEETYFIFRAIREIIPLLILLVGVTGIVLIACRVTQLKKSLDNSPRNESNLDSEYDPFSKLGINLDEFIFEGTNIPQTGLHVGKEQRLFKGDRDELITIIRQKGVLCGCGHEVYSVNPELSENGTVRRLGGPCRFCALEAQEAVKNGSITVSQAEQRSLFCSECAGFCEECRHRICLRHTSEHETDEGIKLLCPSCLEIAKRTVLDNILLAILDSLNKKLQQSPPVQIRSLRDAE